MSLFSKDIVGANFAPPLSEPKFDFLDVLEYVTKYILKRCESTQKKRKK